MKELKWIDNARQYMRIFSILLLLVLAGCDTEYKLYRDKAFFEITIVDEIVPYKGDNVVGYTDCKLGVCSVQILRSHYPDCIEHEVRHGFEGYWHGDIPTVCR